MELDQIILGERDISNFKSTFETKVNQIIRRLNTCESVFEGLMLANKHPKYKWVNEHVFLSLESAVSSLRLLAEGHINAAGNTMRISYEALCMSILLSSPRKLKAGRGKTAKEIDFYSSFMSEDNLAKAHLSIGMVIQNSTALGLVSGNEWLKQAKDFYNGYSHASKMVFSSLTLESGKSIVGGGYNEEKQDIVSQHLEYIDRLAMQMPELIKEIATRNLTLS